MAAVAELPLGLRVALLIVVGDAAYYAAHRASHAVPWLWRFHRIHHSPTELDWLVNTRAHPVDLMVARIVPLVPLLVFGLRQPGLRDMEAVAALYLTLTTVWAFFVHANVRVRLGPLEHVVTSPAFHHWHHHHEAGAPQHCNFASLLPVLDRLFGTWHLPRDRLPEAYGAADPLPPTLAGQLLSPFRASRRVDARGRKRKSPAEAGLSRETSTRPSPREITSSWQRRPERQRRRRLGRGGLAALALATRGGGGSGSGCGGSGFSGGVFGVDLRLGDRDDHRVLRAVAHGLDAGRELQVGHVQRLALDQAAQVDGDEFRQLRWPGIPLRLRWRRG